MKKEIGIQEKNMKMKEEEREKEIIFALREMDIDDIKCGSASCNPSAFQFLAHRNVYLLLYCVSGLVIGMFFTYHVSTISTIEKRFKLTSKQTGIMLAGNDISQILFATIVAYFGNYGNRPKWLGVGLISSSLACFLSVVPHLVYGPGQEAIDVALSLKSHTTINESRTLGTPYAETSSKSDLCFAPYVGKCEDETEADLNSSSLGALIILFLAEFFVGLTIATFYSLGIVYLDDNIDKKDSPAYYAISMIVRVVGPVLGYLLGSRCLSYYIDPSYQPNISLRDPRWLGAWWLGFLVLGVLMMICGILLLLFPRTLPSTLYKQIKKIYEEESTDSAAPLNKDADLRYFYALAKAKQRFTKPVLQELPSALKRLFTNKIWVGVNFNTVFVILAVVGYWNFKPKYLEYQFRKSASTATFYTGIASLVASILGLSISGLLIKVFRPGPRVIAGYACFLTVFSSITMFSLSAIGCPKVDVLGIDSSSNSSCNADCGCTDRYLPVCSEDKLTMFYSPCYAGCTDVNITASPVEYLNCRCVASSSSNHTSTSMEVQTTTQESIHGFSVGGHGKATQGYCPETCNMFFYYVLITIITKTVDSTGRIGSTLIYLRTVEEHDKGLSLGVSVVILSLFAFIPGPIIMGAFVDSACIIWDNTCGQQGNCWLYDSDKFRLIIHIVPGVLILVSLIGDLIVFANSRDLVLYEDRDKSRRASEQKSSESLTQDGREMKLLNAAIS